MSVHVMLFGRLGNNLFQYAFGRIIAEHHGWELRCTRFPLSANSEFQRLARMGPTITLISAQEAFPNAPLRIAGADHEAPGDRYVWGEMPDWDAQTVDLASIISNSSPRRVVLAGFFQRAEYYLPHQNKIKSWFSVQGGRDLPNVNENDIVVNIRGGQDFSELGWVIAGDYYRSALDRISNPGKIYVCGVGIDDEIRLTLAPYKPIYFEGEPLDHFRFVSSFRRMVLPNSTFSWWAGFLSEAEEIYVPAPDEAVGYHFGKGGVDLDMRSSHYRKVAC